MFSKTVFLWFLWNFSEQLFWKKEQTTLALSLVLLQTVVLKSFDKISQALGKLPKFKNTSKWSCRKLQIYSKSLKGSTCLYTSFHNPVKQLRWKNLGKYFTDLRHQPFPQRPPFPNFDRLYNTPFCGTFSLKTR